MPVHNEAIARAFEEIADLLEIQDANPFRVRAYRNAARTVGSVAIDLEAAARRGKPLPKLPGIGADLSGKIREVARNGSCDLLERLRGQFPEGMTELLRIPGLGPRRVRALYRDLGISTVPALQRAAREGTIRKLAGFGAKSEAAILQAAQEHGARARRYDFALASRIADALVEELRRARGVQSALAAGSLRRRRATVGDIDILVTAADSREAMRRFLAYPEVKEVLSAGRKRASVVLKSGIQADLRVVPEESYGAALVYFTGSKAHNIALRRRAQLRGLKINEYGVFRGTRRIAGDTEESVYAALGLRTIPPMQREDRGEIEAAQLGR